MLRHHLRLYSLAALLALTIFTSCSKEGGEPPEYPCHIPLSIDSLRVTLSSLGTPHAIVRFQTSKPARASFHFFPVQEPHKVLVAKSSVGSSHEVALTMLKPSTSYLAVVGSSAAYCTAVPDTVAFTTDSLPSFLPQHTLKTSLANFPQGMFVLANKNTVPTLLMALDDSAKTVWYYSPEKAILTFNTTVDQTILLALTGNELREINLLGETVWSHSLPASGGHAQVHHDLYKDAQGRVVSLTEVDTVMDLTAQGGGPADLLVGDGIVVVNRAGEIEWEWNIFEHADPRTDSSIASTHADWSHANSIAATPDGHYLIGFRNFSQIWKLHATTGAVMWKLGHGGDFSLPSEGTFIRQHHAHMINSSLLMMFDNGDGVRPYSRALCLSLDEAIGSASIYLDARLPDSLLTTKMGGAYLLPFQNILMNSTDRNAIVITTKTGQVIWMAQDGYPSYKAMPFSPFATPIIE